MSESEVMVKKSYLSKTNIINVLIALFALLGDFIAPGTSDWFKAHPTEVLTGFSFINVILRFLTKSKVQLW